MTVLRLPGAIYEELRAHGEETYPRECCGAVLGRMISGDWQVEVLLRATNICGGSEGDSGHDRYEIAAAELVRIAREARGRGLEIAGFYHSHPDHPARWSATDLKEAHWIGLSYVITEIVQGKAAATNAFLLAGASEEEKRFEALEIEIEGLSG